MIEKVFLKLFPQKCIFCGENCMDFKTSPVCFKCLNSLEYWGECCIKCGKKMSSYEICGECLKKEEIFDFLIHIYSYEGKAKEIINLFKFKGFYYFADFFSNKIFEFLKKLPEEYQDAPFCFVPHHPYRIFSRNYNPVEFIVKFLCKKFKIVFFNSLKKAKIKRPQTNLSKEIREKNVKGTFKFKGKFCPEKVIIFDDVYTTGATLKECAEVLRKAGVKFIAGLTLARV